MADTNALTELRIKELSMLRKRIEKKVRIKPGPTNPRRIAGIDLAITRPAAKVHVCVSLMSAARFEVLEESIGTDDLNMPAYRALGNLVFVPLILSVLKMLKRKVDVVVIRELSLKDEMPLSTFVGVISGRPSFGVSESSSGFHKLATWEGVRRAGPVKLRGHKMSLSVVAGHLMTFKDAATIVRATAKETRLPEPLRNAGMRVRAWEREWRRLNLPTTASRPRRS